jgi:hypothetical protein
MNSRTVLRDIRNRLRDIRKVYKTRYLSVGLPRSVPEGRVLMHNHIIHGPNWPTGPNGFLAWTAIMPYEGFVRCPCGWAGLPHYAMRGHVQAYRENPDRYRRRVRYVERRWGRAGR